MEASRELKEYEANFLFTLAKKGELEYTELIHDKNIAGSSRTIRKAIKYLENPLRYKKEKNILKIKLNLIKSRKGKNRHIFNRGKKSTYYKLTLFGLLRLFHHFRNNNKKLLKIFQEKTESVGKESIPLIIDMFRKDVPLLFDNWEYFKEVDLEEIVQKHLINVLEIAGHFFRQSLETIENAEEIENNVWMKNWFKEFKEKTSKSKYWAQKITDIFLYRGLKRDYLMEHRISFIKPLPYNESAALRKVIEKNSKLNIYCSMLSKEESKDYIWKKPTMFGSDSTLLLDSSTVNIEVINKLSEYKRREIDGLYPLERIAEHAFRGRYFFTAVELVRLYKNYTFTSILECAKAIFGLTKQLARTSNVLLDSAMFLEENNEKKYEDSRKKLLETFKIISKRTKSKVEPKDLLEYWSSQKKKILGALYFFNLREVTIWDETYYQLMINSERIKEFHENKKKENQPNTFLSVRKKALAHVKNQLEEITQKDSLIDCNKKLLSITNEILS